MTQINKGYKDEEFMRKWFKGQESQKDWVDFKTKNILYEVKSCNLMNSCTNGNHKRKYVSKRHKKCYTHQLGRFNIITENHIRLGEDTEKENKVYLFVIRIGTQRIWKSIRWSEIDKIINKDIEYNQLRISEVFYGIYSST